MNERKCNSKDMITNNQPKRLRRLKVIFTNRCRPMFFVTACMADRRPLLANDTVHKAFVGFCNASPLKVKTWVGRYILMPDHLHVFVSTKGSQSLSRWVGSLKKYLAVTIRANGYRSPFWQEGFFDHLLRSGESYSEKWGYVRDNPVRSGLVQNAEEWPYTGEIHRLPWD